MFLILGLLKAFNSVLLAETIGSVTKSTVVCLGLSWFKTESSISYKPPQSWWSLYYCDSHFPTGHKYCLLIFPSLRRSGIQKQEAFSKQKGAGSTEGSMDSATCGLPSGGSSCSHLGTNPEEPDGHCAWLSVRG